MAKLTNSFITQLERLYRDYGQRHYGENCTQYEHMAQCGWWADQKGYGEELAITAFLHDVGHLIAEDQEIEGRDALGYPQHDSLAEQWLLEQGLPEKVCIPIGMHVEAKRYLVTRNKSYERGLSEASKATLAQQGGPFTEAECLNFESSPHFDQAIRLRELDELGKADDFNLPQLDYWLRRIEKYLS
ncbi:hypothetical protein [Alkalimarinus coralli]|uniref:hypothetical protein n=1 Tax=Alkalimarinus coralli TaxID=2935863 RepID=UPI00202AFEB2|nr:hypothetical protein [Alkalimarinus coralli]